MPATPKQEGGCLVAFGLLYLWSGLLSLAGTIVLAFLGDIGTASLGGINAMLLLMIWGAIKLATAGRRS